MMDIIQTLQTTYQDLRLNNLQDLRACYDDQVVFIDPVNKIEGLETLMQHFESLYENIQYCRFHFVEEGQYIGADMAYLPWRMEFAHPKLNRGQAVWVDGVSQLKYNDKVYFHRDWFDMGAMVYENVPVVGGLVKLIKNKQKVPSAT